MKKPLGAALLEALGVEHSRVNSFEITCTAKANMVLEIVLVEQVVDVDGKLQTALDDLGNEYVLHQTREVTLEGE